MKKWRDIRSNVQNSSKRVKLYKRLIDFMCLDWDKDTLPTTSNKLSWLFIKTCSPSIQVIPHVSCANTYWVTWPSQHLVPMSKCAYTNINFRVFFSLNIWGRISNYSHITCWDVITHPDPNFRGGFIKPPMKLGHGWDIISHTDERSHAYDYLSMC